MRINTLTKSALVPGLLFGILVAVTASAVSTIDSGGQRTTSANYTMDGSLNGFGGSVSSAEHTVIVKSGYVGQLYEVMSLGVIAATNPLNEGETTSLGGLAGMDDDTVVVLEGSNVQWDAPISPIASITSGGLATVLAVCSNTCGDVTGRYLGVTGSGILLILDRNPDNFGLYACDGISDGWQVRHFGLDNPLGLAWATNCTGRNNLYTYTADLDPNNPHSVFEIVAISNQPPDRLVSFRNTSTARVYRLLYTTNLVSGVWTNLPGETTVPGVAGCMTFSDTNAPTGRRFYRVHVQLP